jgi:hypothetical protein
MYPYVQIDLDRGPAAALRPWYRVASVYMSRYLYHVLFGRLGMQQTTYAISYPQKKTGMQHRHPRAKQPLLY